jgi:hypothetical protein
MKVLVGKSARSVHTLPAGRRPKACVAKKLLTVERAARYKRISSLMEDEDADDQDPDH